MIMILMIIGKKFHFPQKMQWFMYGIIMFIDTKLDYLPMHQGD